LLLIELSSQYVVKGSVFSGLFHDFLVRVSFSDLCHQIVRVHDSGYLFVVHSDAAGLQFHLDGAPAVAALALVKDLFN